jgi:hypothetical protein
MKGNLTTQKTELKKVKEKKEKQGTDFTTCYRQFCERKKLKLLNLSAVEIMTHFFPQRF